MSKHNHQKPSPQTQAEALKIAKATQRPAQSKEQTKLIAQGIQKGIDLYKKQQKERARELSKKLKKAVNQEQLHHSDGEPSQEERVVVRQHWLPWLLLVLTWVGWGIYFFAANN